MPRKRETSLIRRYCWTILGTTYLGLLVAVGAGAGSWQTPDADAPNATLIASR
jgi:hypothetical protein